MTEFKEFTSITIKEGKVNPFAYPNKRIHLQEDPQLELSRLSNQFWWKHTSSLGLQPLRS